MSHFTDSGRKWPLGSTDVSAGVGDIDTKAKKTINGVLGDVGTGLTTSAPTAPIVIAGEGIAFQKPPAWTTPQTYVRRIDPHKYYYGRNIIAQDPLGDIVVLLTNESGDAPLRSPPSGLANTIDGWVANIPGSVVLLTNQTNPVENGLYVVGSGPWARAPFFTNGTAINTVYVYCVAGDHAARWTVMVGQGPDQHIIGTDTIRMYGIAPTVKAIAVHNIDLTTAPPSTIDGVSTSTSGDRFLLVGQTDPRKNGVYQSFGASFPFTRTFGCEDWFNVSLPYTRHMSGNTIRALGGTAFGGRSFTCVAPPGNDLNDGLTPLPFTSFDTSNSLSNWYDESGVCVTATHPSQELWVPIDGYLIDGSTITLLYAWFEVQDSSKAALPTTYPTLWISRRNLVTGYVETLGHTGSNTFAAPANLSAYANSGTPNRIQFVPNNTGATAVVDLATYTYAALYIDDNAQQVTQGAVFNRMRGFELHMGNVTDQRQP